MENQELVKCSHCEEDFKADEITAIHNGSKVCENCLSNDFSYCDDTSEYYPNDEMILVYYSNSTGRKCEKWVHESCLERNYVECEDGDYVAERDTFEAHVSRFRKIIISRWEYDEGEFFTCDDCAEIFHNDLYNNVDDRCICNSCYNESYSSCDYCGEHYHVDNGPSCGCDDEESCSGLIHSCSFKPAPKFQGKSNKLSPFIGFELEIESESGSKNEKAQFCHDSLGHVVYLKEDGSLSDGFEIVSHPMTLEVHQSKSYKTMFDELAKLGAKSHDTNTCGLHFHLDKTRMTDAHKSRFGIFFALEKNKLEILARRTSEQYAKFKAKNIKDKKEYSKSRSRYEAVNWENEHTVEVRIFKGTLKYETFIASMELCHAIYVFTSIKQTFCTLNDNQLWSRFVTFVKKNKSEYSHLISYLESKKELLDKAIKLDDLESRKLKIENEINKVSSTMTVNDLETA